MSTAPNSRKNKKGTIWIWIALLILILCSLEDVSEEAVITFANIGVILLVVFLLGLPRKNRPASAKTEHASRAAEHSHDRIEHAEKYSYCTGEEHWRRQLDGFLKAGIIDRKEYRVLWERWTAENSENHKI